MLGPPARPVPKTLGQQPISIRDEHACPYADEDGECGCCVDDRTIECVAEYASTCDGCAELTMHDTMWMDPETHLGYCEGCVKQAVRHMFNQKPGKQATTGCLQKKKKYLE